MRFSRAVSIVLLSAACATGCKQGDGAGPAETGDVPNRLHDLQRDLESVVSGETDAPKDLADDLAVFTDDPAGTSAARSLAGGISIMIVKRTFTPDAEKQLALLLFKTVASRDLSERQVDALKDDMRSVLMSIGVSQADANKVADRVGATQKAVTQRTRHWYERY
jgi:hypothetical protein